MSLLLLTNDDGIHASGINALRHRLEQIDGLEIWVVAPDRERSASGHAITTHRPLFCQPVAIAGAKSACYSVTGTPADSAKLAIEALLPRRPDLVISGINRGANLGTDLFYSGTVAAALEGPIASIPALAVSLATGQQRDEAAAADFTAALALRVLAEGLPAHTLLNVNLPAVAKEALKGVRLTKMGRRLYIDQWDRRVDPRGRPYYWLAGEISDPENEPDSDIVAVAEGYISITPVHLDLTHHAQMERLRAWNLQV